MPSFSHLNSFHSTHASHTEKNSLSNSSNSSSFAIDLENLVHHPSLHDSSDHQGTTDDSPVHIRVLGDKQLTNDAAVIDPHDAEEHNDSLATEQVDDVTGPAEDHAVRADVSAMRVAREKYSSANMSIVVLFHNEYSSMNRALESWVDNGLIDYTQEILFFLNGVNSEADFKAGVPDYEAKIPAEKRRLYVSTENMPLGLAITKMIEMASHEYVLLLEKDWQLIEKQPVMESRLIDSKVLIGSGVAHLVRHRHRKNPGVPLHALIMHQGREESIIRQQKNLLCYVHHWQKKPSNEYPGKGLMWRCGGESNFVEEEDIYCSSSEYCQWTNNPGIFKRSWFLNELGEEYRKQYAIEFKQHGKTSPFLDFEYYTNWRSYAWTDKNFTVAVGTGLFSHAETEHKHFNTFWYAHYRLTVDLEEIRNTYLKNESTFKSIGGVHYHPNYSKPLTMMERYPVEFVRSYQFEDMFTGNVETQREIIQEAYKPFLDTYRVLTEEEWTQGGGSEKAKKSVDWRGGITRLHHAVERAMMIAPPEEPHEMTITLVTSLLDIGRHGLAKDGYMFRREFQMYIDATLDWVKHKYNKTVYTSEDIAKVLLGNMTEEAKATTKFVYTSREELRTKWLGRDNYEKVQEIRKSKAWIERSSWLANSPQGGLADYNPLVMSKMFMMRDAARQNLWNTSHFVYLDAKHNCRIPKVMTPKNDHIIRAHMFDKFLLTTFDYMPDTEVHGFEYKAFNEYCNIGSAEKRQLVKVGRGGIFGGSAFVLEYMAAMYDIALTATLRQGVMGTEENILSILKYQVKQYVDDFSNNWACGRKIEGDHTCTDQKVQGYNCAIFDWVARDAVREE